MHTEASIILQLKQIYLVLAVCDDLLLVLVGLVVHLHDPVEYPFVLGHEFLHWDTLVLILGKDQSLLKIFNFLDAVATLLSDHVELSNLFDCRLRLESCQGVIKNRCWTIVTLLNVKSEISGVILVRLLGFICLGLLGVYWELYITPLMFLNRWFNVRWILPSNLLNRIWIISQIQGWLPTRRRRAVRQRQLLVLVL